MPLPVMEPHTFCIALQCNRSATQVTQPTIILNSFIITTAVITHQHKLAYLLAKMPRIEFCTKSGWAKTGQFQNAITLTCMNGF